MSEARSTSVVVIGAGAWGTALANCLAHAGNDVTLWGRASVAVERLAQRRAHDALPDVALHRAIDCTPVLECAALADVVVLATPAQTVRTMTRRLKDLLGPDVGIIIAAKGVEKGTGMLMPQVVDSILPDNPVGMLSGPTFATELSQGLPTAATLAAAQEATARRLAQPFTDSALRLYTSGDIVGVALGGAFKNVLAIAAGAVMGARLGSNARAAVISRGLAELSRLGRAVGASAETLGGLSGLGDIVLSCTDPQSRNYAYGQALGSGQPPPPRLAEGVFTVAPLLSLAERHEVEMPIARAVDAVVNHDADLRDVVAALLNRPQRRE